MYVTYLLKDRGSLDARAHSAFSPLQGIFACCALQCLMYCIRRQLFLPLPPLLLIYAHDIDLWNCLHANLQHLAT